MKVQRPKARRMRKRSSWALPILGWFSPPALDDFVLAVDPLVDRTYPLSETPTAVGYVEEGHARGKVIIVV
jgi:hypothetical protein